MYSETRHKNAASKMLKAFFTLGKQSMIYMIVYIYYFKKNYIFIIKENKVCIFRCQNLFISQSLHNLDLKTNCR